jgi:prepilin-type processing-associated H-X9-DG protein
MGILMPSLSRAKEHAKRTACSQNLKTIGLGMFMYADGEDGRLPESKDPGHPYVAFRDSFGPTALGLLFTTKIVPDGKTFYCASNMIDWLKYKNYVHPAPWGTLPQAYNTSEGLNQWVRTGYSHYPQSKRRDENGWREVAKKRIELQTNKTMVTDAIWQKSKLSHVTGDQPSGLNAVFGDGHVRFTTTSAAFTDELWGTNDEEVRPESDEFHIILDLLEP